MSKTLIIVESPGKTSKIQSYAGKDYVVKASVGHIIDLPEKKLGVDVDNEFEPEYIDIERQAKNIKDLAQAIKNADDIILAADLDREGEMIAWSIAYRFKLKSPKRITFDAITKDKIQHALKHPRDINYDLVDAQKARRILDRLIGYKLSPLVQKHVSFSAKSAGRVQSVVVKLIIEKEEEIKAFFKEESSSFYKVDGLFNYEKMELNTSLHEKGKFKEGFYNGETFKEEKKSNMEKIMKKFGDSKFKVVAKSEKEFTSGPSPPFTTSTLLQEATSKLGMSSNTVKASSQKLYNKSFITYIRTDTTALSSEAIDGIKHYVVGKFGESYYTMRNSGAKGKTQEAHEAIRPTDFNLIYLPEDKELNEADKRLYNLIWRRAIASQMSPAVYNKYTVQIEASKEKSYLFNNSYDKLLFPGYLKVYANSNDYEKKMNEIKMPNIDDELEPVKIEAYEEYNRPPTRYTESSLINKLDPKNLNIGRPSTYNTILSKILEREYVEIKDVDGIVKKSNTMIIDFSKSSKIMEENKEIKLGDDKNKFVPTELGIMTTKYLNDHFTKIMDYEFTAMMENNLDDIAAGEKEWRKVIGDFWKEFVPMLEEQRKAKPDVDKFKKSLGIHPNGIEIMARIGRYGPMIEMCKTKDECVYAPIKKPLTLENITLEDAIKLFEYPKILGKIGDDDAVLYKGKYGLYVKYGKDKIAIPPEMTEKALTIDYVKKLIETKAKKNLGEMSDDMKIYSFLVGPYGRYIKITDKNPKGKPKPMNVSLPEDVKIEELTIEKIKEIIDLHFKNRFKKKTFNKEQDKQEGGNKKIIKTSRPKRFSKFTKKY
jgi:DNA topoisomerase I